MKIINTLTSVVIGSLFVGGVALAQDTSLEPKEILAPIQKVFLPTGFDNNDNTEVIVHGHFPNSCFKVGHSNYEVDMNKKEITVSLSAYEYRSSFCVQIVTPFTQSIKVGVLPAGNYNVKVKGTELEQPLMIASSMTSNFRASCRLQKK